MLFVLPPHGLLHVEDGLARDRRRKLLHLRHSPVARQVIRTICAPRFSVVSSTEYSSFGEL
jgi:hypothetical protein